jgi:hypothetical protein
MTTITVRDPRMTVTMTVDLEDCHDDLILAVYYGLDTMISKYGDKASDRTVKLRSIRHGIRSSTRRLMSS